jgi:hypothetical protein
MFVDYIPLFYNSVPQNRDAEHQLLQDRLVLLQKQLVEKGKCSAEIKTGK